MSGLFRHGQGKAGHERRNFDKKKSEKKERKRRHGKKEEEDTTIDLLSMKVKDQNGEEFGEVVSADEESIVIKHKGKFYLFPAEHVQNRFGDLMIVGSPDMVEALEKGEQWRNTGKEIITENKHYDFSEKRREEKEREERIKEEIEKVRALALQEEKAKQELAGEDEEKAKESPENDEGDAEGDEGVEGQEIETHEAEADPGGQEKE